MAVQYTSTGFDIRLARWLPLKNQEGISLEKTYLAWQQQPMNMCQSYDEKLRHILRSWHENHGRGATVPCFLDILRSKEWMR